LVFSIQDKTVLRSGLGDKWYNSVALWWGIAFGIMILIVLYFSVFI